MAVALRGLNYIFLFFFFLCTFLLLYYHLYQAPINLAQWPFPGDHKTWLEHRWALLHCYSKMWSATKADFKDGVWLAFQDADAGDRNLFWMMYRRPYFYYMFHSIVNFIFMWLPILYILFITSHWGAWWAKLARSSAILLFRSPEANEVKIADRLGESLRRTQRVFQAYGWILVGSTLYMLFEEMFGKQTLANSAQFISLLAILLLMVSAARAILLRKGLIGDKELLETAYQKAVRSTAKFDESGEIARAIARMGRPHKGTDVIRIVIAVIGILVLVSQYVIHLFKPWLL
jgi:hypothetical protein